jgi:hypothetical protein
VAEYQITQALPDHLKGSLPAIAELEATLSEVEDDEDGELNDR